MSVTPRISARAARFAGVAAAASALALGAAGTASACNISEFTAVAECAGEQGVITVVDKDPSGVKATVSVYLKSGGTEKLIGSQDVQGTREGATLTFKENWQPNATYRVHVKAGDQVDEDISPDVTAPGKACATTPAPSKPAPSKPAPSKPAPSKPAPSTSAPASPTPAAPAPSNSPAPAGSSDNLAETGSSSNTPLFAGLAAALVVAGGGIVFALRKRGAAQR
ncbi:MULTISPECIES: LAETG motif-containing sortase-dependent surface protein [Streptomyces]|uniref:LPXTG cell wall anchor domain-containing protein n=1 Tax=Streptomyces xanthii TaxID=2768069 RepID=A0A7H1B537_9ACTN|nr:LAETG motif-containing sortase-dependent surface protein [Streptomyces xanthii]QNS03842.1 LPXTG cell wall anchor domain-containing protein [Streptomyces xanthii]